MPKVEVDKRSRKWEKKESVETFVLFQRTFILITGLLQTKLRFSNQISSDVVFDLHLSVQVKVFAPEALLRAGVAWRGSEWEAADHRWTEAGGRRGGGGGVDVPVCLFGPELKKKWKVHRWLIVVFRSEVMKVSTGTHGSAPSGRWMHSHRRDTAPSNHS